jgi:hypothetical protein
VASFATRAHHAPPPSSTRPTSTSSTPRATPP